MTGLAELLDLLFPTGCAVCRAWIPGLAGRAQAIVCPRCLAGLDPGAWPRCSRCHAPRGTGREPTGDCLDCRPWGDLALDARYACMLAPPASDLVHGLKYEGWRALAEPMGGRMAGALQERRDDWVVVPLPTAPRRVAARGFDQADLLSTVVAERLGLPLVRALRRIRETRSQTELPPEARRENVRDAFVHVAGAGECRGRPVLLIDDVLTTGATACAAAETLVERGVEHVTLLVFARAMPGPGGRRARLRAA